MRKGGAGKERGGEGRGGDEKQKGRGVKWNSNVVSRAVAKYRSRLNPEID